MTVVGEKKRVEQYTEAESREIYELMLASGKIIQVTSDGVRVFYKVSKFGTQEILKARRVFPRIDRTDKLDNLLDRIYGQSKNDKELKQEIIDAVYRPIKREIDEILIDNRNFLVDHAAMAKIRTDLNGVIKNLDGLTLNMLNTVLTEDKSKFKRNIEFAVYSGLIASVIFGDYKTRSSDRKIVEDVILIAITYSVKDETLKHRMFANFKKKDATQHYKLDFILKEVVNAEKSVSNIISEILSVSQKYTEIINSTDNEPLRALMTLANEIQENTAVAVGALFTKYTLREYRNRYKRLEEKLKESLTLAEDKLRVQLMRRISKDSKIICKLAAFFLEDIAIKQAFKTGYQRVLRFKEFQAALDGISKNCGNYLERLKGLDGEAYRILEDHTENALSAINLVTKEFSDTVKTPERTVPDVEIWSCISAGNKYSDVDFVLGYAVLNLKEFAEKGSQIYRVNQKLELRRNFSAINETIHKLRHYLIDDQENLYDITKIVGIASRKLKDSPEIRIIRGVPSKYIPVFINPFKVERALSTLLENAIDAIQARTQAQKQEDPDSFRIHHINVILKDQGEHCTIRIQDSGGGMETETYNAIFARREPLGPAKKGTSLIAMQKYLDTIPGASLSVDVKQGLGTTIEITLPVTVQNPQDNLSSDQIISALEQRHWNI